MFLLNNRLYEQEGAGPDPEADRLHAARLLRNAKASMAAVCAATLALQQGGRLGRAHAQCRAGQRPRAVFSTLASSEQGAVFCSQNDTSYV